jgi:nitroimidazol reductase NimA-like FMN-containing flavoprotein (pyridoxamine 5'-phosphate oxidase superfamily)
MAKMTEAQWREFVMAGTRTGKLAVTRLDGRPHVTPIWFVLDGDDIVLTTHRDGIKGKALQRDPRAALTGRRSSAPATACRASCSSGCARRRSSRCVT